MTAAGALVLAGTRPDTHTQCDSRATGPVLGSSEVHRHSPARLDKGARPGALLCDLPPSNASIGC